MTLKKLLLMGCLGGALAFTACDKDNDDPVVTEEFTQADSTFLSNAAYGNLAEIKVGQLAATQGSNDSVKAFGQTLVTTHQAAQMSLDSIATTQSITLPDTVNNTGQGLYNALVGLTGAAFDSASEALVQDALENLMRGRTSFVIAHRLSTIRNADQILVLDKGYIKENGTHNELMSLDDGLYKSLNKMQFQETES